MSVQAQWSLERSSRNVIGITRGILQAATTDNVQVLAIIACERFGATLAMSPDTARKIEREVVPTPDPSLLAFLKVQVGYLADDCAVQIGRSQAGIHFLGLATALVTTMNDFNGATVIQAMLEDTAADRTLIPTVRQLQDLLSSIEPRCLRADFAKEVAGWQISLNGSSRGYFRDGEADVERTLLGKSVSCVPDCQGIQNLVTAFRQLRRIGPEGITRISIRTTASCAAWTIAFVKWCLGLPPSVAFDDGTAFLPNDKSEVCMIIVSATCFQVTVHSAVDSPSDLIDSGRGQVVQGMVEIAQFGELLLQHILLDPFVNEEGNRAMHQAIPYALDQVLKRLSFVDELPKKGDGLLMTEDRMKNLFPCRQLTPFPEKIAVCKVYSLLFGMNTVSSFPELEEGLRIGDLPLVQMHLKTLQKKCICSKCGRSSFYPLCEQVEFLKNISTVVATILALSLFHYPASLRFCSDFIYSPRIHLQNDFFNAVCDILSKGTNSVSSTWSLNSWCLELVGHPSSTEVSTSKRFPILSCYKGQALWLTIHQTYNCTNDGFLSLSWLPGSLIYQNEKYSLIRGTSDQSILSRSDPLAKVCQGEPVLEVRNLCPSNSRLSWSIKAMGDRTLEAALEAAGLSYYKTPARPEMLPGLLATTFVVSDCYHAPSSKLAAPDRFASFVGPPALPLLPRKVVDGYVNVVVVEDGAVDVAKVKDGHVNIVAVDSSDEMKYFALSIMALTPPSNGIVLTRRKGNGLEDSLRGANFPRWHHLDKLLMTISGGTNFSKQGLEV